MKLTQHQRPVKTPCPLQSKGYSLPAKFGDYTVNFETGRSAMAVVYLARHTQTGQYVSLKIQRTKRHTLYREAETLRQIRLLHGGVCEVLDEGQVDGLSYVCLELGHGKHLSAMLGQPGDFRPIDAVKIAMGTGKILVTGHTLGIVHLNLSPGNILLDANGLPHLHDFGVAFEIGKQTPRPLELTPSLLPYMAPEMIDPAFGARGVSCDIYSLGVVLYEMLTGFTPFAASQDDLCNAVLNEVPLEPSLIPGIAIEKDLERACLKALAKRPAHRFASMGEFVAALKKCELCVVSQA